MQVNNINNNAFLPIAQKIRLRRVELAKMHKCPNLAEKRLKLAPPPKISTIMLHNLRFFRTALRLCGKQKW